MRRVAAVAALVLGLLAFSTATASAEAPLRVTGQITDPAGALGAQTPAVQAALDRLTAESNLRLYVVYVQNFSGRDGQDWADRSAQASRSTTAPTASRSTRRSRSPTRSSPTSRPATSVRD